MKKLICVAGVAALVVLGAQTLRAPRGRTLLTPPERQALRDAPNSPAPSGRAIPVNIASAGHKIRIGLNQVLALAMTSEPNHPSVYPSYDQSLFRFLSQQHQRHTVTVHHLQAVKLTGPEGADLSVIAFDPNDPNAAGVGGTKEVFRVKVIIQKDPVAPDQADMGIASEERRAELEKEARQEIEALYQKKRAEMTAQLAKKRSFDADKAKQKVDAAMGARLDPGADDPGAEAGQTAPAAPASKSGVGPATPGSPPPQKPARTPDPTTLKAYQQWREDVALEIQIGAIKPPASAAITPEALPATLKSVYQRMREKARAAGYPKVYRQDVRGGPLVIFEDKDGRKTYYDLDGREFLQFMRSPR